MVQISIDVTTSCPSCTRAKRLLKSLGQKWNEINIEKEGLSRYDLSQLTGGYTVPQIVIGDQTVGGFSELFALHQSGTLKALLADQADA